MGDLARKALEFWPDSDRYDTIETVSLDESRQLWAHLHTHRSISESWTPVAVEFDTRGKASDFPCLNLSTPVFTARAWAALAPLLKGHAEALPLICDEVELYAINLFDELDCLDFDKSEYKWEQWPTGPACRVRHYVLRPEAIAGHPMYRIKDVFAGPVCVSQEFADVSNAAGLVGVKFRDLP